MVLDAEDKSNIAKVTSLLKQHEKALTWVMVCGGYNDDGSDFKPWTAGTKRTVFLQNIEGRKGTMQDTEAGNVSYGYLAAKKENMLEQWSTAYLASAASKDPQLNNIFMDPMSMQTMVNNIIWPALSKLSEGFVDNPSDKDNPSMRMIPVKSVFNHNGGRQLGSRFYAIMKYLFNCPSYTKMSTGTSPKDTVFEGLGELRRAFKDTFGTSEKNNSKGELADKVKQKEFLQLFFAEEAVAKLYWLANYFCPSTAYAGPIKAAAINPFTGFMMTYVAWTNQSIEGSYGKRGIAKGMNQQGGKNWLTWTQAEVDKVFLQDLAMLGGHYKWITSLKTKDKANYDQQVARFLTSPTSVVNMLVILCERVLANANSEFKFTPKCTASFTKLATVIRSTFKIEIGDDVAGQLAPPPPPPPAP